MGLLTDASVINIEGNTKQLVDQINKADVAMRNFDSTLTAILSHLTAVETGLKNVNGVTNNFNKTQKGNFFNAPTNSFAGARGSAASFTSTRSNAYKQAAEDYHRLQQQEIEVMKTQIAKDKKIIQYKDKQIQEYANEVAVRRINANAKYKKSEYLNSAEHLSYEAGLGTKHQNLAGWYAAKSAHPERFLAGALNYSFSHQGARALSGIGDSVRGVGVGGRIAGDILNTAGSFLKAPAAGIMAIFKNLGQEMIDLGKAATQAYAEIESIKTQLGVVFSNQTQADSMFGQISQYAVKSPFGVQQTSELAVLLKQSGVYASDLMDTLKMLGDTAGGNMEKMKRIANNYAQIVSIGKASMLDMRQFAYAGIPIFEAVSKELGVSQQELRKLISDGKVTSDIIEKVFKDLTGINGLFENATEKGAKTLKARLQNLSDARQLAFGEIGNFAVDLGSRTGGDSFVKNLVDIAEKMYDHLKTEVSTKNIEKDVQVIATRNNDIERYKTLISFAQATGNKTLEAAFTAKLNELISKLNPDEARSTYVQSYNNKTRGFDLLREADVVGTTASIQKEIDEIYEKIDSLNKGYWERQSITEANPDHTLARILLGKYSAAVGDSWFGSAVKGSDESMQIEALEERAELLHEILDALKDYNNISDELRRAIKEDAVIQAQQLQFDTTNRNADASSSLNASFNELASILENSDEYKQKEEEKRMKILQNAQEELKKIAAKADENGNIRFNEFDREEFQRLNTAGAFNATKLGVVQGNKQLTAENRAKLESQFANASGKVLEELGSSRIMSTVLGQQAKSAIEKSFMSLAGITDDKEFFNQFATVMHDMTNSLKQLEDFNPADRAWLQSLQDYLIQSTNTYEARVKGANADLSATDKSGTKDIFVPLWKRILSQYTGLTTTGMTDTISTLTNYRDDMAIRNTTASVLKATLSSVGYDAAMGLIKTGSAEQLAGDNGKTFQTDWQVTQKAVKEFALSLKATTEVVSAYRKGLEDQMEVYEQLLAAGPTQAESTDLGSQKFVTVKQLEKLSQGNSSQLVNAFGEVIRTKSGEEYKASEVIFKNGKMFDKLGNEITDEVEITGNLFEFIKAELPKLRAEIAEARVKEANSAEYDKVVAEWAKHELTNRVANFMSGYHSELSGYLLDNPDYVYTQFNNLFQTVLDKHKEDKRYEDLIASGNKNVLSTALMATPEFLDNMHKSGWSTDRYDAANELVQETLDLVVQAAKQLGVADTGSVYQTFRDNLNTTEFNKLVSDRFRVLINSAPAQQLSLGAYADQNGIGGSRGVTARVLSNFFGLDRGYDLQSLYAYGREKGASLSITDSMKKKYNYEKEGNTLNVLPGEELSGDMEKLYEAAVRFNQSMKDTEEVARELGADLQGAFGTFARGAWEKPFEKMGENLLLGKEATDGMEDVFKNLSAEILKASSAAMVKAGWELVARGAANESYGMIAGGLGLVAAGGVAAGFSSALTQKDDKDKSNKEAEKLESLKSDLQKLLEQARTDALYYENNLRHQTALGLNREFSYKSVHDAILTPKGDVVTTDPKDYLIATKQPQNLVGGGNVTVQPVINNNIVNNTSSHVRQEQTQNADGSIDILTIIEDTVGQYIASPKSDDAFATREYRMRGRQAIM